MKLKQGMNPADLILDEDIETISDAGVPRLKEHHNFYVRSMFNALTPTFFNRYDMITEEDVSGELIEALRVVQQTVAPDLQEGEFVKVKYEDINDIFDLDGAFQSFDTGSSLVEGIGDEIRLALGNFAIGRIDGKIKVVDAYDFQHTGEVDTLGMTMKTIRQKDDAVYYAARYLGEKLLPAKTGMGPNYSPLEDDDFTQIRITLPDEPMHENIDFDDFADGEASEYVLRGPMTNKRKEAFTKFMAQRQQ